jgi:hypothetical protein
VTLGCSTRVDSAFSSAFNQLGLAQSLRQVFPIVFLCCCFGNGAIALQLSSPDQPNIWNSASSSEDITIITVEIAAMVGST